MLEAPGFLELSEGRLEYLWHGPGPAEAPTFVFLHEGLGCTELWRDVPEELARRTGFGALVYSRHGYGASDPRPLPWGIDFMQREALDVLPRVLAATAISDAVLVGHSDGASIALIHAGGSPAKAVRSLVLEAPHVFTEAKGQANIQATAEQFQGRDLRRRLMKYHGANVDVAFRGWSEAWLDPAFLDWNIEAFLPSITVPILLAQGLDDPYGTLDQVEAIARQAGGGAETLLLADCGHAPHLDQRARFLDAVCRFVADVPAPRRP